MDNCFENLPGQTKDIYEFLLRGRFLSEDSPQFEGLYKVLVENEDILRAYFRKIGLELKKGDGYYYFARDEEQQTLENKIEAAYNWIDLLDFMVSFAQAQQTVFTKGFSFTKAELENACDVNSELQYKLENLLLVKKAKKNNSLADKVEKVIGEFRKSGFIEEIDPTVRRYRILASIGYLESLVMALNLPEEENNVE